jgi:hypothetical protein
MRHVSFRDPRQRKDCLHFFPPYMANFHPHEERLSLSLCRLPWDCLILVERLHGTRAHPTIVVQRRVQCKVHNHGVLSQQSGQD